MESNFSDKNFEAIMAKLMANDLVLATTLSMAAAAHGDSHRHLDICEKAFSKQKITGASPEFEEQVRANMVSIVERAKALFDQK